MNIKVALAGNPNSGKTTLFNALTGSSQYVGNWPGVTVEKKSGKIKRSISEHNVDVIDLPGIYSLSPYSLEEVVARDYLIEERPDVIINVVDSSNLERNLYLTTQLMEQGIPIVIALNMIDIVRKRGDVIDIDLLSKELGCIVIEASASKGLGLKEITEAVVNVASSKANDVIMPVYNESLEKGLKEIEALIPKTINEENKRWFTIKLFEKDKKIITSLGLKDNDTLKNIINKLEKEFDDDSESIVINERYEYLTNIVKRSVNKKELDLTLSDKIDLVLTNRWLGLPIFALIMFMVYYVSISTVGTWATDWVNEVLFGEVIPVAVEDFLVSVNVADWLQSFVLDGVIGGVGAVLGFLPQMLVLFLCLAILEDCGYMARIAFIMDKVFSKFGLSGKSFIPVLISTGCGVPGIMASRTIENERDRKMTIILTTFIPCSAKLPIIALIAGALFPDSIWIAPSAYFIGIAAIICSGIILKKTNLFAGDTAPFVIELPAYHIPRLKNVGLQIYDKGKSFVKKAGTTIFLACALIWFLSTFNWRLEMVDTGESMLATMGKTIAIIFNPLGWGDWRATVATVTGFVAKENIVGTLGILHGFEEVAEDGIEIWGNLQASYSQLSAYSFLVFNLLCSPCFAAIGAIKKEMGSNKWTLLAIGYQTGLAYIVAFMIYQFGSLMAGKSFNIFSVIATIIFVLFTYMLVRPESKGTKSK